MIFVYIKIKNLVASEHSQIQHDINILTNNNLENNSFNKQHSGDNGAFWIQRLIEVFFLEWK